MKLACFPLELGKPLLRKPYTREAPSSTQARMLLYYVAASAGRPQTEPRLKKPLQNAREQE